VCEGDMMVGQPCARSGSRARGAVDVSEDDQIFDVLWMAE
jgi:hypothetical protein